MYIEEQDNMDELVVEGLTPEDFKLVQAILKSYKVSLCDTISFEDVNNLYSKISEIVNYLEQ